MMEAREEAAVEEEPGAECSARIVLRWAMQELQWFQVLVGSGVIDGNTRLWNAGLKSRWGRGQ
jgi:hypothetical protein